MAASRVVHVTSSDDGVAAHELREGIARIQEELQVTPEFPAEVITAAKAAVAAPRLPDLDRTDLPLVTIDPPTSMDLDQAMHIVRDGDGYVVYYAIADLAAFISPGDPIDEEAHRRGQTLYGADSKVPLHPPLISEGAASLLPDQVCPALLWTIKVDETGEGTDVTVERARVRSTAKLDYAGVQRAIDDGSAAESLMLLKEVGELRLAREAARGGVSLPLPEQEVSMEGDRWSLEFRAQLPTEQWNAQISLLTGMAAASLMVYGRVGLLRTLPPADPRDVQRLHRTARALGIDWPAEMLVPRLHPVARPEHPHPRGDGDRVHAAAPRQWLRRVRGRAARPGGALGAGVGVRPRDRAAAAARRPLRGRDLPRPVLGAGRAGVGARPSGRAAQHHAAVRPALPPLRGGGRRPGRGRGAASSASARSSRESSSTSTPRTTSAAPSPCRTPPSRHGSPPPSPCRWATR